MKRKIPGIIQLLLLIIIFCVCSVLIVVSIRNKKEINFKNKKIEFLESELVYSRHQAFEMNTMFEGFCVGSFTKYITSGGEVVEIGDIVDKFPVICLYFSDNSCSSCIDELIDYINESDFLSCFRFIVFTPLSSARLDEQLASYIKKEVIFLSSDRMDELLGLISENPIVFALNEEMEIHHVIKFLTSDKNNIYEYFSGLLDRYYQSD